MFVLMWHPNSEISQLKWLKIWKINREFSLNIFKMLTMPDIRMCIPFGDTINTNKQHLRYKEKLDHTYEYFRPCLIKYFKGKLDNTCVWGWFCTHLTYKSNRRVQRGSYPNPLPRFSDTKWLDPFLQQDSWIWNTEWTWTMDRCIKTVYFKYFLHGV